MAHALRYPWRMVIRSTTVLAVRRNGVTAMAADGQVTLQDRTIKHTARKVRSINNGSALIGIAGSAADAQTLADRIESKLQASNGNLRRAAVEFAKEWRSDKVLRHLDAMILAADKECVLAIGGDGNVLEPDEGVIGIGSGGGYAHAAALALIRGTELGAEQIARAALEVSAEICIFTNDKIIIETIG